MSLTCGGIAGAPASKRRVHFLRLQSGYQWERYRGLAAAPERRNIAELADSSAGQLWRSKMTSDIYAEGIGDVGWFCRFDCEILFEFRISSLCTQEKTLMVAPHQRVLRGAKSAA